MESMKIAASTQNNKIVSQRAGLILEVTPERVFVQRVPDFKEGEAYIQIIRKNILKSVPLLSHVVLNIVEDHDTIVCITKKSIFLIKPITGGKYALLNELTDPALVKSIKEKEHAILGASSGNKSWVAVKKCYDVLVVVTNVINGITTLNEVKKNVYETVQEWVDAPPTTPTWGPGGPGTHLPNPNHVRSGY